jgi:hypothetical protein
MFHEFSADAAPGADREHLTTFSLRKTCGVDEVMVAGCDDHAGDRGVREIPRGVGDLVELCYECAVAAVFACAERDAPAEGLGNRVELERVVSVAAHKDEVVSLDVEGSGENLGQPRRFGGGEVPVAGEVFGVDEDDLSFFDHARIMTKGCYREIETAWHPCVSVHVVSTLQTTANDHQRDRPISTRWRIWIAMFFVVPILIGMEVENPILTVLFVYVILYPSFAFVMAVIKILRFNFIPSPLQLWKGFRRQWHVIEKGPVVVRVHRKKPSST